MEKTRFIYLVDLLLVPAFLLTLVSGLGLHAAGHGAGDAARHFCAWFHVLAAAAFLLLGFFHVRSHWGWYRALRHTAFDGRKCAVLAFSVLFAATLLTGVALPVLPHGAWHAGLLHYQIGLLCSLFGVLHVARRWKRLRQGVSRHLFGSPKS